MTEKILHFLRKHEIEVGDILYITREDHKTCLHLTEGRIQETYIPAKDFLEVLAPYDYICISKGTIVAKNQIDYIKDCTYHMKDGATFSGRKRTVAAHKQLNQRLHLAQTPIADTSVSIQTRFSVLDKMPVAFCVIELVFAENGAGTDFIFRYCNQAMEVVEGKSIDEMLNQSFFRVFPNADKKWLVTYSDVALNGGNKRILDYSPEIDKKLFVTCFQPIAGFCACLLTPTEDLQNLSPSMPEITWG